MPNPRFLTMVLAAGGTMLTPLPAHAATDADDTRIAALEARIAAQDARIASLERLIARQPGPQSSAPAHVRAAIPASAQPTRWAAPPSPPPAAAAPVRPQDKPASRLSLSGDLRLRQEFNSSDRNAPDRARSVMRARLAAAYALDKRFTVGARLTTGDPDDPNTTDVTMGQFVDDLTVSLDRAYVRGKFGVLTLSGGKFALPFHRTDLVWDGDFNPQGAAAVVDLPLNDTGLSARLAGLYAALDEAPAGKDSDLLGAQASLSTGKHPGWDLDLSASYLDYHLNSLAGADAGDFRSNLRRADGSYLSDFELIDVLATLHLAGLSEHWPLSLTAEAVRNLGAATHADTGLFASMAVGTTNYIHGTRLSYGYMQAETDAVFAAFSHDNIGLATNYRLHQFAVDHALTSRTTLNLTWYLYRPLDSDLAAPIDAHNWLSRVRLNAEFSF